MAKHSVFAASMAASGSRPEAEAAARRAATEAQMASVTGMQSSAEVTQCRAQMDIAPSRPDRMTTARPCSPAASRRPDKSSKRHRCKFDCIGDSASYWPRFVINAESTSSREAGYARIHSLRFRFASVYPRSEARSRADSIKTLLHFAAVARSPPVNHAQDARAPITDHKVRPQRPQNLVPVG